MRTFKLMGSVAGRLLVCCVLGNAVVSSSSSAEPEREGAFVALFDGKTIDNCSSDPKFWSVENGAVTGGTTTQQPTTGNTFCIWQGGAGEDSLKAAEGLQVTTFASEPRMTNPTNVDVDHLGRVWVCDVMNYRSNAGSRPQGDRILIQEDTDGDGVADRHTVFYQGNDIDSALGICVLDNRVIVSCAPNVFLLTDDDRDGRADRKETLFSKVGSPQHDHATHAFVFGPDGKLYWNYGNFGRQVCDAEGNIITDVEGNQVVDAGRPYIGGMVFRCNPDGSEFEVLAHNFRNAYEVAVDSYGTLWQSDNDDDGNRSARINYVMEGGNFGYRHELTGAGWRAETYADDVPVPERHWHQRDPGVIPNLLVTGAGSPSGICVYEGTLLPRAFRNQVIHCEPGVNVVRAYPVRTAGAGYAASMTNLLEAAGDQSFRPVDVAVAPDGSLFVADWYDPGVGGHRQADLHNGRIYRLAPEGTAYRVPALDLDSPEGAVRALQSPNLSARYLAWQRLHDLQGKAEPALRSLWENGPPRLRARALWLLSRIQPRAKFYIQQGLCDSDPNLRTTALRAGRQIGMPVEELVEALINDKSPAVRRECAIALRRCRGPKKAALWAALAQTYDGKDRWYLEALGTGARNDWDTCLDAWLATSPSSDAAYKGLVWRSRATKTAGLLTELATDPAISQAEYDRLLRSFAFLPQDSRDSALRTLLRHDWSANPARGKSSRLFAVRGLDRNVAELTEQDRKVIRAVVNGTRGSSEFIELVGRFGLTEHYPALLKILLKHPREQRAADAMSVLVKRGEHVRIHEVLTGKDKEAALATALAMAAIGDPYFTETLLQISSSDAEPMRLRRAATVALGKTKPGARALLKLVADGQLANELMEPARSALTTTAVSGVRTEAAKFFPPPLTKDNKTIPTLDNLAAMHGNPKKGESLFAGASTCAKCHKVNGKGDDIGPDLSEIGSKLAPVAMFEAILFPSAGISHNYEAYLVATVEGKIMQGLLLSETQQELVLKDAKGIVHRIPQDDVEEFATQSISIMPADLQKHLTLQELVHIVAYMKTLRKK